MANDPMRSKAAATFGKEFMNVVKGNDPTGNQVNSAQALQKRANARPIPVYKDGGAISKAAIDQARVATRAKAAGYKDGGVKKRAEGGSVDRNKAKLDRKMEDIKKDYEKALAKGKSDSIAKAKYEQRMADARDDYAKWTKADRTETKAAERAAETTLSEARKTRGTNIVKRDAPSVMAEMVKAQAEPATKSPASDLAKTIKIETDVARKTGSKPVQRGAASRSNGRIAAPKAERAMTPAPAPQKQRQAPSAGRMGSGVNQNVGRAAFAKAGLDKAPPAKAAGMTPEERNKFRNIISGAGPVGAIIASAGDAVRAERERAALEAKAAKARANRPLDLRGAKTGVGPMASGYKYAAGGAAKVRKGQAPIKKGR